MWQVAFHEVSAECAGQSADLSGARLLILLALLWQAASVATHLEQVFLNISITCVQQLLYLCPLS